MSLSNSKEESGSKRVTNETAKSEVEAQGNTERKKAEENLSLSEEKYRNLLQQAPVPIYEIDFTGPRFISANDAMVAMSGYTREELLSKNPLIGLAPESQMRFKQRIGKALAGEKIDESVEYEAITKDGRHFWVTLNMKFLTKEGKTYGAQVVAHDITDRKKVEDALRESEERFRSAMDNMIEGCQIIGRDWRYIYINDAAEGHNRRPKTELLGNRYMDMWPGIQSTRVFDVIRRCMDEKESQNMENEFAFPDGTIRWFDLRIEPVPEGVFILSIDITDRKKAEVALRQSEQRWATTLTSIGDAVISTDAEGKIVFMNALAEKLTGWTLSEVSSKPVKDVFKIVNEQTRQAVQDPVAKVLEHGMIVGLANHTVLIRKDGTTIAIDDSGAPITSKDGKTTGVVLVFRDITERKKAEEALRLLNERFEMAQHAAGVGVWDWDIKTAHLEWSPEMFRLFGLDPQKSSATFSIWKAVLHPEDKEKAASKIDQALKEHSFLDNEYRIIRPDGKIVWINALGQGEYNSEGQPVRMIGICIDITERKKSEEALRRANENLETRVYERTKEVLGERQRLYSILETLPAYVVLLDKDYNVPFANKVFRERFGESHGKRCYEFLFNRNSPCENCETYKVLKNNKNHHWEWTGPDKRDYDIFDFPFVEADGSTLILEMGIDITERKSAEKQVHDASLYSRSLIEASLDPLVTISAEGKITDANGAAELATGCSREELIGSDFSDFFTEPEKAKNGYKQVFTKGFVRDYPLAIRRKSGKPLDVLYNAAVYRNEAGEVQGVFAAARDITQLKKAEERAQEAAQKLKDAERLAAIGATAGMVGHDIRNPLQAITSDVYLAKSDLASMPDGEEKKGMQESLEEIEKNVYYINKIVADLQDYARPLKPTTQETNLPKLIRDLLAKNGVPKKVKVQVKVQKEASTLMADSDMLKRVMGNLITNAVQAMPEGGKLTINACKEGNEDIITVQDTGVGIPENIKSKLFTPLFTTKSKGQGFGLAVVKRMTEALGGTVTFESEIGKGTKFTITLPAKLDPK